ncbi:Acylphosphatase [Spirochaeta thermophila DSM 6578]|uniref:Acylphosphatase n=1 Tax=Winmispira thermophila (strain ATCC 700085 / DSM 6578 / Z-1203) TaxID=869211 RepID=G0GEX2_WINT7|nr:acylphosphatase [Spirochaeta thermophila]AEJ62316.1 Acylphosphatase [Spirochaeta thermophila DSM 6578]
MKAFFARVEGRVQGVGFRYSCLQKARALGLVGWVRNTPDGAVEVYAEGPEAALEELARWLHKGPLYAQVLNVEIRPMQPTATHHEFRIAY